jgi:hypothetical protein
MLSQPDLIQARDYVIRILPEILRQDPEIGTAIEDILAQQFPRRDKLARALDEFALLREDRNRRFIQPFDLDGWDKWMNLNFLEKLQTDKGESLESMFAAALRYGLNNPNITADQIQLQQPLIDHDGQVFRKNFATEINVITENHRRTVFEVRTTAKVDNIYLFWMKVKLVTLQNPEKPIHGVFICQGANEALQQHGAEYGLEVII